LSNNNKTRALIKSSVTLNLVAFLEVNKQTHDRQGYFL